MDDKIVERYLVKQILEEPLGKNREWTLQGFGMLRLYLTESIRLHIWDSRFGIDSSIHTHPWAFSSRIVVGRIHNTKYREVQDPVYLHYNKMLIKPGLELEAKGDPTLVFLEVLPVHTYRQGEYYNQAHNELHQTSYMDGTVTILKQFRGDLSDEAYTYWPYGEQWKNCKPVPAKDEDVINICNNSLHKWFRVPIGWTE